MIPEDKQKLLTMLALLVVGAVCLPLGVAAYKAQTFTNYHNLRLLSIMLLGLFLGFTVTGALVFEFKRIAGVVYTFGVGTFFCTMTLCYAIAEAPVR